MTAALDHALPAADAGVVEHGRSIDPDPEVPQRARRRSFTAAYKLEVLAAYDAAGPGEKGAISRREGLYTSHIVEWRRARDSGGAGCFGPAAGPQAGPIPAMRRLRHFEGRNSSWSRSWPKPAS